MVTLVDCPQSDTGQWSFHLFGTTVRVKVWFWVTLLILGSARELGGILIWAGVCFVSILLHEMGHVFALRLFRRRSDVVLYGFGGVTIPYRDVAGTVPEVLVALAGPLAGFCLAGLTAGAVTLTGGAIFRSWHMWLPHLNAVLGHRLWTPGHAVWLYVHAYILVNDLLFVNFYWGLVNLLPIWPLDGGHISRALFEHWDDSSGRRKSLVVSAAIAGAIALDGMANQNVWLTLMFGIFAISSLQAMEGLRRHRIAAYQRWRG